MTAQQNGPPGNAEGRPWLGEPETAHNRTANAWESVNRRPRPMMADRPDTDQQPDRVPVPRDLDDRYDLSEHVENFRRRVLLDAVAEATESYWLRRAAVFDAARPRLGEPQGAASRSAVAERDARLAATALACRRRAALALVTTGDLWEQAIDEVLAEYDQEHQDDQAAPALRLVENREDGTR